MNDWLAISVMKNLKYSSVSTSDVTYMSLCPHIDGDSCVDNELAIMSMLGDMRIAHKFSLLRVSGSIRVKAWIVFWIGSCSRVDLDQKRSQEGMLITYAVKIDERRCYLEGTICNATIRGAILGQKVYP